MQTIIKNNYIETVYTLSDAEKIIKRRSKEKVKALLWKTFYRWFMPILCIGSIVLAEIYVQAGGIAIVMIPAAIYFRTARIEDK